MFSRLNSVAVSCCTMVVLFGCTDGTPPLTSVDPPAGGTGALTVELAISGDLPDPDGINVVIDGPGGQIGPVPADIPPAGWDSTFAGLEPGQYVVNLTDVANNCGSDRSLPYPTTVVADRRRVVPIELDCSPVGSRIKTTTLGSGATGDSFMVTVGAEAYSVAANGVVEISTSPGEQTVQVSGLPTGCGLTGDNPRSVVAEFGGLVNLDLGVLCPPFRNHIAYCGSGDNPYGFPPPWDVYITPLDGSGVVNLTPGVAESCEPDWSPDGSQIVYVDWGPGGGLVVLDLDSLSRTRFGGGITPAWSPDGSQIAVAGVWVMNADGSDLRMVVHGRCESPTWSPDGSQIAFVTGQDCGPGDPEVGKGVYVANLDGSRQHRITDDWYDVDPSWSPLNRIAFTRYGRGFDIVDIFAMNPDGSDVVQVTNFPDAYAYEVEWSPDGEWLGFSYGDDGTLEQRICVIREDGSGFRCITDGSASAAYMTWSPME